eukprot:674649_1
MASLRTYKRKRNRDDKASLQRKKQKQCHPRNRPYVIMNYDSVIQREKDIIFNGLRMAPTHLHDDIKLVIFEYVKSPFEHLGATFLHKHKSMQLVIYGHGYNKYTIQKCDNCFAFFNQKCDNYQYEDPNIKDWFIHQEFQCCFCQKNLCRDCGGLPMDHMVQPGLDHHLCIVVMNVALVYGVIGIKIAVNVAPPKEIVVLYVMKGFARNYFVPKHIKHVLQITDGYHGGNDESYRTNQA